MQFKEFDWLCGQGIFNNYSPKWRWIVMDIYRAAKRRGKYPSLSPTLRWIIVLVYTTLVQSLNSPFFPLHIGAQPGRAKEESRITCMRMLRTTPFFPPKSGGKPYLEVLSRFGLWRDFLNDNIQATISAFRLIKNTSINPKSVEFHQCHANPHSICFLSQYQR